MITSCWFITGTSKGLGKALAETVLKQQSAIVHGFARHAAIHHERYVHHTIDLADPAALTGIDFQVMDSVTEIVLINNAGALGDIVFTGALQDDEIRQVYQLNAITPHILCNRFIAEHAKRAARKIIINITSGAAKSPYDGWSMYCASKAALDMMTLCVAQEQAQKDPTTAVHIYAIAPGVMDTAMQQHIRSAQDASFSRKNKFVELWKNDQLYKVEAVAEKLASFVSACNGTEETIQRIVL